MGLVSVNGCCVCLFERLVGVLEIVEYASRKYTHCKNML